MTLELLGLRKTYPDGGGLRDLTLAVPQGSLTALLGPSGAGKTTAMRLVAGLLAPDAGDIRLDGQSILALAPDRRGVVLVFQNALLFPHLTLAENVGFGLRMRGVPGAEIARRVDAMLGRVELDGLGNRRPDQLSGGQQQRGALARALVLEPKVLLLDEPLSNLDAGLRDGMRALITGLQRETGVTMLVVTHDQTEAVVMADRIALILDGRLAQEAAPEGMFRRPASVAVARFFGGANFLPGRVEGGLFQGPVGPLKVPASLPSGTGWLTIRPEAVVLAGPDPMLAGQVRAVTFLGAQSRVLVEVRGQTLTALTTPDLARGLHPGTSVGVTLPPPALWLIPDPEVRAAPSLAEAVKQNRA